MYNQSKQGRKEKLPSLNINLNMNKGRELRAARDT